MRIVLVAARSPGEFRGGTELVVEAQARELARLGHAVRLVCGTDEPGGGDDVLRGLHAGLEVVRLPRRPGEEAPFFLERPRLEALAAAEVERADAELVHVHGWETLSSALVRTLARSRPVVLTLHDALASCPRAFRRSPVAGVACPADRALDACASCVAPEAGPIPREALLELLERRRAAFEAEIAAAAAWIVPSRSHLEALRGALELPEGRGRVLRHGLCQPLERVAPASGAFDGTRPLRVLHFGNRSSAKGTLDLVDALAPLGPACAELLLAGPALEPGLEAEVRRRAGRLFLSWAGTYDAAVLARLAARADLAAFPSRLPESYALVVEEALALGLPAWVADRGAAPELVLPPMPGRPGPGRILPAEEPGAWTRAFRELFHFPKMLAEERDALPARPRTAAQAAAELADLYRSLVQPPRHQSALAS